MSRHVGVISLAHPNRVRRLALTDTPSWSPDARRIFVVPPHDVRAGESTPVQLAAWPGGTRVPLPRRFEAEWLPGETSLIALPGDIELSSDGEVPPVVQVGADGKITRTIPCGGPSQDGYVPTRIPIAIEGIDPD